MVFMGSRRLLAFAGLAVWRILAVAGVGKNIFFHFVYFWTDLLRCLIDWNVKNSFNAFMFINQCRLRFFWDCHHQYRHDHAIRLYYRLSCWYLWLPSPDFWHHHHHYHHHDHAHLYCRLSCLCLCLPSPALHQLNSKTHQGHLYHDDQGGDDVDVNRSDYDDT